MFFYIYKPDSVVDSHLSGNIVANILKRHPKHLALARYLSQKFVKSIKSIKSKNLLRKFFLLTFDFRLLTRVSHDSEMLSTALHLGKDLAVSPLMFP